MILLGEERWKEEPKKGLFRGSGPELEGTTSPSVNSLLELNCEF